jgi:xylan 1,4-beta-xylosidase
MKAFDEDDHFIVEGPSLIYRNNFYYLFFSGNTFHSPFYHVSVARSQKATGPYKRSVGDYFLHTDLVCNRFHQFLCILSAH